MGFSSDYAPMNSNKIEQKKKKKTTKMYNYSIQKKKKHFIFSLAVL